MRETRTKRRRVKGMSMAAEGVFRPVRQDEVDAIAEIAVQAWSPIYDLRRRTMGEDLFGRLHGQWRERKAAEVRDAARQRPDCVWVTELEGRVVAFSTFRMDEANGVGELCNNAVDPAFQGRGIGKRQHVSVLKLLAERGMKYVTVLTGLDDAHGPARKTYESVGFKPMSSSIVYVTRL